MYILWDVKMMEEKKIWNGIEEFKGPATGAHLVAPGATVLLYSSYGQARNRGQDKAAQGRTR
jgi:hypothetical protein